MERCEVQLYRTRRSLEKPRVETPPRLQVIGFNVSPPRESAPTVGSRLEPAASPPKPASSPRSALQQLLLHQSLSSTSPRSANLCLPHLKPPSSPSSSSANHAFTAALVVCLQPVCSSAASNQITTSELVHPASSPPSISNQKLTSVGLLQPYNSHSAANQNKTGSILKSLLQSECANSDISANQVSSCNITSSCAAQSICTSSTSSGDETMLNLADSKPSKASIKQNFEPFFPNKRTPDDENDTEEINGPSMNAEKVINEHSYKAKIKKSSCLQDDDDDRASVERGGKGSGKLAQQITEHPPGNEKSRKSRRNEGKSKKSNLFVFVASSPASESHHHHQPTEHDTSTNMDFLSSCHLCRRFLGVDQDVFMYSGDKAFCSMECRDQQIVLDERKERCPPPIIRSGASPVYQHTSVTSTTTLHPIMINNPHFINNAAAA